MIIFRSKNESILTKTLFIRILTAAFIIVCGTLYTFIHEMNEFQVTKKDNTMTFTVFVFFDMFNALSCRSESKSIFKIGFFCNVLLDE